MRCGITLLILIVILSIIGTIIPQGVNEHLYSSNNPPVITKLLTTLGLNDVYNSTLFGALFIALTLNLMMCSIFRFNNVIKRLKTNPVKNTMKLVGTRDIDSYDSVNSAIDKTFVDHGFHRYYQDKINTNIYYSIRNKAGYFGSWLLHLGILFVIVYYAYGHITYFSESVYGVPGTVQMVRGTEYKVLINDFNIEYGEDGTVEQYTSNIEFLDKTDKSLKASHVAVNAPARLEGYTVYQTAYGWAAKCNVSKYKKGIMEDVIYEKTTLNMPHENIGIYFKSFYPDFAASSRGFTTLSDQLRNPVILYTFIYMGDVVKMDIVPIDEVAKWNEYEFVFHSPQRYTYLDVNRMKGQLGAAIGALLVTIGIILVFYFKPIRMMINIDGGKLYVYRYDTLEKVKTNYQKEKDSYVR